MIRRLIIPATPPKKQPVNQSYGPCRLITRGTIEEKVYHRQIYKQYLTNRILTDPRQKRFIASRDIHDLFSLTDHHHGDTTETGKLFSAVGGDVAVPQALDAASPGSLGGEAGSPRTFDANEADEGANYLEGIGQCVHVQTNNCISQKKPISVCILMVAGLVDRGCAVCMGD